MPRSLVPYVLKFFKIKWAFKFNNSNIVKRKAKIVLYFFDEGSFAHGFNSGYIVKTPNKIQYPIEFLIRFYTGIVSFENLCTNTVSSSRFK